MKNPPLAELQQHFKAVVKNKANTLDKKLSPQDDFETRLQIYQFAFFTRLEESLNEDFSDTRSILGNEKFLKLVEKYTETHPSRSWTLAEYSEKFPDFLKMNIQKKYIYDLAEFEWMKIKCSLGAGAKAFDPQSLLYASEAEWVMAKMKIVPSLTIYSSHWPVNNPTLLPTAADDDSKIYYYALFRSAEGLKVLELTATEVDLLEEMTLGKNFGELASGFNSKGVTEEQVGASVGAWVQQGLIEKVVFDDAKIS